MTERQRQTLKPSKLNTKTRISAARSVHGSQIPPNRNQPSAARAPLLALKNAVFSLHD